VTGHDPIGGGQNPLAARLAPYHYVVDGTAYPAVLLTAGEFNPRLDTHHTKKMTARLQAATSSGAPLLRWKPAATASASRSSGRSGSSRTSWRSPRRNSVCLIPDATAHRRPVSRG
jgi:hypothetical protein